MKVFCILFTIMTVAEFIEAKSCQETQQQYQKMHGPFVAFQYWYPKCLKGDYWQSVQCNRLVCYCAYLDNGNPNPNTLSHLFYDYMIENCPIEAENRPDPCSAPLPDYPCKNTSTRFYYDEKTDKCRRVTGTCLGFQAIKQCQEVCVVHKQDRCNFRRHLGRVCDKRKPALRWHHDEETGACEKFVYRGCGGNSNNYKEEWICMEKCKPNDYEKVVIRVEVVRYIVTLPKWLIMQHKLNISITNDITIDQFKLFEDFMKDLGTLPEDDKPEPSEEDQVQRPEFADPNMTRAEICDLPKDPGPCRGYEPRWHFSAKDSKCHRFIYGQCAGNGNNFETVMHCAEFCRAKVKPTELEILESKFPIIFALGPTSKPKPSTTTSGERSLNLGPPGGEGNKTKDKEIIIEKETETEIEFSFE